jgi:hypothetical protein
VSAVLFAAGLCCAATEVDSSPKLLDFDPAKYTGETGKIKLPIAGQTATVLLIKVLDGGKLGDFLELYGKGDSLAAPVGSYKVSYFTVNVIGKDGRTLTLSNSSVGEEKEVLEIKAGESVAIEWAEQLVASIKAGKTGKITVPYSGNSSVHLHVVEKDGRDTRLQVSGKSNEIAVPTGKYQLVGYRTMVTAKDKTGWYISIAKQGGDTLEITPTTNVKVKSSPSIVASVKVSQNGDQVSMALEMAADNGDKCTIMPLDSKAQPPSFQVLNKSGEVLMSGKFAYG